MSMEHEQDMWAAIVSNDEQPAHTLPLDREELADMMEGNERARRKAERAEAANVCKQTAEQEGWDG